MVRPVGKSPRAQARVLSARARRGSPPRTRTGARLVPGAGAPRGGGGGARGARPDRRLPGQLHHVAVRRLRHVHAAVPAERPAALRESAGAGQHAPAGAADDRLHQGRHRCARARPPASPPGLGRVRFVDTSAASAGRTEPPGARSVRASGSGAAQRRPLSCGNAHPGDARAPRHAPPRAPEPVGTQLPEAAAAHTSPRRPPQVSRPTDCRRALPASACPTCRPSWPASRAPTRRWRAAPTTPRMRTMLVPLLQATRRALLLTRRRVRCPRARVGSPAHLPSRPAPLTGDHRRHRDGVLRCAPARAARRPPAP